VFNTLDELQYVLVKIEAGESVMVGASPIEQLSTYGVDVFEITSTSNSTVDEWLLANTEGVSV
jgi:hypothetical protein